MDIKSILSMVDHTLLSQTATREQIIKLCDDGMKYNVASVCIPPSYVKEVREYVGRNMNVCTVVGFPNGYSTTACKLFETSDAIDSGADEIDMVINLGWLKDKLHDKVKNEIAEIKKLCGKRILKVIIETCLLSDDEKVIMCEIVKDSGADYIKTSTGFSKCGAAFDDIKLFKRNAGSDLKIKAAGGISSLEDAEMFIKLGASRLGTSRLIKLAQEKEAKAGDFS